MDTLKDPAMIFALVDAIALAGISVYFNRRITALEELSTTVGNDIKTLKDHAAASRVFQDNASQAIGHLDQWAKKVNGKIAKIEKSLGQLGDLSEDLESLKESLHEAGIEGQSEAPKKKPAKKPIKKHLKKEEPAEDSGEDQEDEERSVNGALKALKRG